MKEKLNIIICPNCGAEYLPAEIFLPDSFLGRPGVVDKDSSGKIIYYKNGNIVHNVNNQRFLKSLAYDFT